jgi:hypothetical protein
MDIKSAAAATTYIICGDLIQLTGYVVNSWIGAITVIIGIVVLFNGLNRLKTVLDADGEKGVGLIRTSLIIALVGGVIDIIPFFGGFIAPTFYMIAFIVQILGYVRLRKSDSIGEVGKNGVPIMYASVVFAFLAVLFSILPVVGSTIGGLCSLAAMLCLVSAWLRIQEGILGKLA